MGFFDVFFGKNKEVIDKLNEKINNLEATIARKDKEISDLIAENEKLNQQCNPMSNKQLDLIEKNLKETKDEAFKLRSIISDYNLPLVRQAHYYKVEIERFYSSPKFKDIVTELLKLNIAYLQDLQLNTFNSLDSNTKNLEDAKSKYDKYIKKINIDWDIITYLNKGERVNKIYNKHRKFSMFIADEGIEFIEELYNYDFKKLLNYGFTQDQIDELIEKRDEFYLEKRVTK